MRSPIAPAARAARRRARARLAQHLRGRFSRKTLVVDIVIAVVITALVAFVVFNAQSGEKKIQQKIERLYSTEDPQFLRAMGVLLGPPVVERQPLPACSSTATRSSRRCSRRSAARRRRSPSRPTSTGRATIGKEFADALAERARAGVKVHVLLDWVGSAEDGRGARRRDEGGRRRDPASTTRRAGTHLGRLNNRTHRKLLVVDGRVGFTGGVGIADAVDRRRAGRGALARHALPRRRARSSRRCRRSSWTTGSRPPARCCTAPTTSRRSQPVGDGAAQVFSSSPSGGSESMQLMYLLSITAAKRTIRPVERVLRARRARRATTMVEALKRGVKRADHHARRAHRHRDRARAPRARAGASCSQPAPRSTSTSRRCSTAR